MSDMVTDRDAAEIAKRPFTGNEKRLLAFRERLLALLAGLLPAVECPWEKDGTCTEENCMKEEARELLEETHRE